MTDLPPNLPIDPIDRYLDGAMSPQEAAAFEREIASSPELGEQVRLQKILDDSIRSSFAPPSAPPLKLTDSSTPKTARSWPRPLKIFMALAATVAIVVGYQAFTWITTPGAPPRPTLVRTYQNLVKAGFRPAEACTTRERFAQWMQSRYHAPLAPVEDRPNVKLVGWSYSNTISNYTGELLALVDGKPVVVILDTIDARDTAGSPCWRYPADDKVVNVFPAEIDGVALYEVSPFDKPMIVDNLASLKR
ncbi:MAG: hypothetical protein U0573_08250 [Phycisphaerales bacterium]|nr:hypothetical protein [Planctomycetota bacterium]